MFVRQRKVRLAARLGKKLMELNLQFGYGMMEHSRMLVSRWGGGTVILSPRDLSADQLTRLAASINGLPGGAVLLDPQFYLPHADHERLCSHEYWPPEYQTGTFWQGAPLTTLLTRLRNLNNELATHEFILPGMLAGVIDDDWLEIQRLVLEEARALDTGMLLVATIALSADATRNVDQVALLLEAASRWRADGYYIVCEHPNGSYLVDDPIWLANILDLVAGLRLGGARVILGYCNHQMLIAAAAKASAVASGTWMNVRSFPPDKFRVIYDEEIKQRTTWYYCPQALSEYKVPFLDIAYRQHVLGLMAPPPELTGGQVLPLFSGTQPSSVGFTEQAAFRHYLNSMKVQVAGAGAATFNDTVAAQEAALDEAESLLSTLSAAGIRGQQRDFSSIIDVNRAALSVLVSTRGAMLRRRWTTL